jgi:hypothetical protein
VELYAEMLHCSNMSILNRAKGSGPEYTADGRLEGGLDALEQLGTALEGVNEAGNDNDEVLNEMTPARDLPVSSSGSTDCSLTGSDDEGEDPIPDRVVHINPSDRGPGDVEPASTVPLEEDEDEPSTPKQTVFDDMTLAAEKLSLATDTSIETEAQAAMRLGGVRDPTGAQKAAPNREEFPSAMAVGDLLKHMYIEHQVLLAVIVSADGLAIFRTDTHELSQDLFFEHPSNNFLHNVTYDIVQQVLNGRIDQGFNRRLVCDLFCDAKIVEKILHTQKLNTELRWVVTCVIVIPHRIFLTYITSTVTVNDRGDWA